jgi:fumarate reductase flavoprotein subunit
LLEQAGATIYRVNIIQDLARLLNIPSDALVDTVAGHNDPRDGGDFSRLAPPRESSSLPKVNALPIRGAPFMAIRVIPGITYTMGRIEIDGHARVISVAGEPIPGLFAAGSATGGLEGGTANAHIGGISKAGVFGLLAAEEVARTVKSGKVDTTVEAPSNRFPTLSMIGRHGRKTASVLSLIAALLMS